MWRAKFRRKIEEEVESSKLQEDIKKPIEGYAKNDQ
jgi:hypothetical protein